MLKRRLIHIFTEIVIGFACVERDFETFKISKLTVCLKFHGLLLLSVVPL